MTGYSHCISIGSHFFGCRPSLLPMMCHDTLTQIAHLDRRAGDRSAWLNAESARPHWCYTTPVIWRNLILFYTSWHNLIHFNQFHTISYKFYMIWYNLMHFDTTWYKLIKHTPLSCSVTGRGIDCGTGEGGGRCYLGPFWDHFDAGALIDSESPIVPTNRQKTPGGQKSEEKVNQGPKVNERNHGVGAGWIILG